jgi:hypothetical protein
MHMQRLTKTAALLTGTLALFVVAATPAHAAPLATSVSPAGDHVSASLPPGGTLNVTLGGTTGTCTSSTSNPSGNKNRIPTAGNPNPSGAVSVKINPPATSGCDDGLPGTTVTVATSGSWKVALQRRPSKVKATLTIPQGGAVITTSGLANCTGTVAPSGPTKVVGTWTNGSPSTITITNESVPVVITGGGLCPTDTTLGFLTVTYQVRDTDHPGTNITVAG